MNVIKKLVCYIRILSEKASSQYHHLELSRLRIFKRVPVFVFLLLSGTALMSGYRSVDSPSVGLKDYYKRYFPIGAAVTPQSLRSDESKLIIQHFNSITAENAMKMGPIHPAENRYFWKDADSIVSFGIAHKLKIRGHCLVWHNQAPRWLFRDAEGKAVTKDVLLQRLQDHIRTVMKRYGNKIYAWDVVNEVIADDSDTYFRRSPFFEITGEEFVEKAFEYAHASNPKALLFYNDYNTEQPVKREKIYRMLKKLLARGVPIHGVGLQAHWSINTPSRDELEKSIEMFSSLGLQIQFTELDISVYTGSQGGQIIRGQRDTSKAVFTAEMEQLQREKYKMVFEVFRKYKKNISGVTFWNISDRYSWLDNRGRKNFPLLFDTKLQPKKAYYEVINF